MTIEDVIEPSIYLPVNTLASQIDRKSSLAIVGFNHLSCSIRSSAATREKRRCSKGSQLIYQPLKHISSNYASYYIPWHFLFLFYLKLKNWNQQFYLVRLVFSRIRSTLIYVDLYKYVGQYQLRQHSFDQLFLSCFSLYKLAVTWN